MRFRLVPKSVTFNDLERRNGHCQVTRTEMTQDTWFSIRIDIFSTTCFLQEQQQCVVVDSVDKFSNVFIASAFKQTRCRLSEVTL